MVNILFAVELNLSTVLVQSLKISCTLFLAAYYTFAKYKELVDNGSSQDIVWRVTIGFDDFARNKTTWLVLGEFGLFSYPFQKLLCGRKTLCSLTVVGARSSYVLFKSSKGQRGDKKTFKLLIYKEIMAEKE